MFHMRRSSDTVSTVEDVAPLAGDLRLAVHRLTRRMRQQQGDRALTLTQGSALAVISRFGPLTAGELALREHVRPPSITRVVTSLEDMGLVTREGNPRDARQVVVRITTSGEAHLKENARIGEAWLTHQLADLSDGDRAVLAQASTLIARLAGGEPDLGET
jgi:DNA-binding MarR family transcriptional regulator